jgi:hypothetical protein
MIGVGSAGRDAPGRPGASPCSSITTLRLAKIGTPGKANPPVNCGLVSLMPTCQDRKSCCERQKCGVFNGTSAAFEIMNYTGSITVNRISICLPASVRNTLADEAKRLGLRSTELLRHVMLGWAQGVEQQRAAATATASPQAARISAYVQAGAGPAPDTGQFRIGRKP